MQYLKDKRTNVVYNIYTFRTKPTHLNSTTQKVCILGNTHSFTKDNEKEVNQNVDDELKNIVWFCYRRNFEPIKLDSMAVELRTDSGWGCMIRVGQMMLFIFLNRLLNKEDSTEKRYAILRKYFKEHGRQMENKTGAEKLEEILGNFENMDEEDKQDHFVEESNENVGDAHENPSEIEETKRKEEVEAQSSGRLTICQIVQHSEREKSRDGASIKNSMDLDQKEDDFVPLQITQRIGSHEFSNMLFTDDQTSEHNTDEHASEDEKSDEEHSEKEEKVPEKQKAAQDEQSIRETKVDDGTNQIASQTNSNEEIRTGVLENEPNSQNGIQPNNIEELQQQPPTENLPIISRPITRRATLPSFDRKSKYDIFSLQNIVIKAQEYLDTVPGSWFRPTTFLMVVKKLIKKYFREVRVVNVIENTIMFGKIHKAVYGTNSEMPTTVPEIIDELSTKQWSNKLLLSISTMLGLESMEPRYKYFLDTLMATKSFCGILGGRHQSAYFIIGNNDRGSYYYLDPHYVKETVSDFSDPKVIENEFFTKKLLEIDYSKLSTSVSLVFFLEGCGDFKVFWEVLKHLEDYYKDDYFMSYMISSEINEEFAEDDIIMF